MYRVSCRRAHEGEIKAADIRMLVCQIMEYAVPRLDFGGPVLGVDQLGFVSELVKSSRQTLRDLVAIFRAGELFGGLATESGSNGGQQFLECDTAAVGVQMVQQLVGEETVIAWK